MANPALDVPEYPDVPDVDGVPPVLRAPGGGVQGDNEVEVTEDALSRSIPTPAVWGLFDQDGLEVLLPDSFLGIRFRDGSRIVDYPLEQGSFESYNKVATPFDVAIRVSIGGGVDRREAFLRQLAFLKQSLDLFVVVTPEYTFQNLNIEAYDYDRRTRNGVSLIEIDVFLREVRTSAVAAFSPVKSDSATDDKKQGQVQAKDPAPLALNSYTSQGVA